VPATKTFLYHTDATSQEFSNEELTFALSTGDTLCVNGLPLFPPPSTSGKNRSLSNGQARELYDKVAYVQSRAAAGASWAEAAHEYNLSVGRAFSAAEAVFRRSISLGETPQRAADAAVASLRSRTTLFASSGVVLTGVDESNNATILVQYRDGGGTEEVKLSSQEVSGGTSAYTTSVLCDYALFFQGWLGAVGPGPAAIVYNNGNIFTAGDALAARRSLESAR